MAGATGVVGVSLLLLGFGAISYCSGCASHRGTRDFAGVSGVLVDIAAVVVCFNGSDGASYGGAAGVAGI